MSTVPFQIPAYPKPLSISQARQDLPPEEFRQRLRSHLKSNPGLTLAQIGRQLNISRQAVHQITGRLSRPNCTSPLFMPLAPKTEEAKRRLPELKRLVAQGMSAERASGQLGISLFQAYQLGFRSKAVRLPHGKRQDCGCWRCRRSVGAALSRRPKVDALQRMAIEDWLAWSDPQDGSRLTQAEIAKLVGISQGAVSRILRSGYAD